MAKTETLNKYTKDEDKLLVAKLLDKIGFAKTKNKIVNTDFLDMYQKKISLEILNIQKEKNYIYYGGVDNADRQMLIIYPEKYDNIFFNNKFNYSEIISLIRIELPNELKGKYVHKDYLSGIMKLGIKREKCGDILVFDDGADIIVSTDIANYILNNLSQLTRFSKSKIEQLDISKVRIPDIKKEEIRITVSSMRLDNIVSQLANVSRTNAEQIIKEQKVFVNYENEMKNSKIINEKDIITIRGKGKFNVLKVNGVSKKGKIILTVEHYV